MTNTTTFPLAFPGQGITMDPTGLFGIERGRNGLLRAVGPKDLHALWWLDDAAANVVAKSFQPRSEDIADLIADGYTGEATYQGIAWVNAWDTMAPGQAMSSLADEYSHMFDILRLPGVVSVQPSREGGFHLAEDVKKGRRSVESASAALTAVMLHNWEGLDGAASVAADDYFEGWEGAAELALLLLGRWDVEVAAARVVLARAA